MVIMGTTKKIDQCKRMMFIVEKYRLFPLLAESFGALFRQRTMSINSG